jgi:hypothetical protein
MKAIRHLARLRFAGQHARHTEHARSGAGTIVAMKDNEQSIAQRIKDLEGAARKARLEAMQIAASLLMKENALLAEPRRPRPSSTSCTPKSTTPSITVRGSSESPE